MEWYWRDETRDERVATGRRMMVLSRRGGSREGGGYISRPESGARASRDRREIDRMHVLAWASKTRKTRERKGPEGEKIDGWEEWPARLAVLVERRSHTQQLRIHPGGVL